MLSPEVQVAVARVRDDVAALHAELVRYNLVVWTGGNVSGRVPGADLFVIKPSGVGYDDLDPSSMILCTLDGEVVPNTPGSDRISASLPVSFRAFPWLTGMHALVSGTFSKSSQEIEPSSILVLREKSVGFI